MGSQISATAALGLALMMLPVSIAPASAVPQTDRQAQQSEQRATQPRTQPAKAVTPAPQTQPSTADVDRLPISLDRIREQLSHEPAFSLNLLRALDIPLFRIERKSEFVFRPDPDYWKDNDVGSDVRPTVNRWHYDFMKMTNPDLPTGYGPGGGVDVLPAIQSAFSGIRHAMQSRERAQARQQIREELRQINEQRRAAGLPPLEEPPPSSTDPSAATSSASPPPASQSPPSTTVVPRPPR